MIFVWYRGYAEKKQKTRSESLHLDLEGSMKRNWETSSLRAAFSLDYEAARLASEGVYVRRKHQGRVGETLQLLRVLLPLCHTLMIVL